MRRTSRTREQEGNEMLTDSFLRKHTYLRVSVTDRCNLRCRYCMPPEGVELVPHDRVLRNEEFITLIGIFQRMGVTKIRFTGGEPLVRKGFMDIVSGTHKQYPDTVLCITTNGILLDEFFTDLHRMGMKKFNISLDTMNRDRFLELTNRDYFDRVLRNIDMVMGNKDLDVKVNAVLLKDTLSEIDDFLDYFSGRNMTMRFIERMPVTEEDMKNEFIPSDDLIEVLSAKGKLVRKETERADVSQRFDLTYKGKLMKIGIIPPVTHKFCSDCNRLRLTSEGYMLTCLHAVNSYNLRDILREGKPVDDIMSLIETGVKEKWNGHKIECTSDNKGCRSLTAGVKSMSSIGG
ncbi:MAG TPA: GTP 3',8-cyclase MoaA [Spirochaetota bacterium]|nr:GTP 3',8-cyclase MoaA [Spirochaetota bacterium]HPJ35492.1 GTP 3',8-cyclase MoaA [Spirochaetota bacterium]